MSTTSCQPFSESDLATIFAAIGELSLDKNFAIGNFLCDAIAGAEIIIQGDGTAPRSYRRATDMAAWLWATLLRGRSGVAYNIGSTEAVSIARLGCRIVQILGSPAGLRILKCARTDQPLERYVPDITLPSAELGLPPSIPLDKAIVRTARWYREQECDA